MDTIDGSAPASANGDPTGWSRASSSTIQILRAAADVRYTLRHYVMAGTRWSTSRMCVGSYRYGRDQEWTKRVDGSKILLTVLAEFDRRGWGEGGTTCIGGAPRRQRPTSGAEPMYRSYGPELTALIGEKAYDKLVELCAAREKSGLVAIHPATAAASATLRTVVSRWLLTTTPAVAFVGAGGRVV